MNALSRLNSRVKWMGGFIAVVCVVAIGITMINATMAEPRIVIRFSHYETNQNFRCAIVDIRNRGTAPAKYRGYAPGQPLGELEHLDHSSQWQGRILFCGTGLREFLLMPGEQVRTTNYLQGVGEWRIGLRYSKPRFVDTLPRRLRTLLAIVPAHRPAHTTWSETFPGFATAADGSQPDSTVVAAE